MYCKVSVFIVMFARLGVKIKLRSLYNIVFPALKDKAIADSFQTRGILPKRTGKKRPNTDYDNRYETKTVTKEAQMLLSFRYHSFKSHAEKFLSTLLLFQNLVCCCLATLKCYLANAYTALRSS